MTTDAQSVALENARLSTRGAIRRAHCVLTWLGKLTLLQAQGLTAEAVLKAWNSNQRWPNRRAEADIFAGFAEAKRCLPTAAPRALVRIRGQDHVSGGCL